MRSMFLEFPNNPASLHTDRQYMLGDSLLVAPVFRHDDIAEYYLPAGEWTDVLSDDPITGGRWVRERVSFLEIPLLARPNSIIAMSENEQEPGWRFNDPLTLCLYGITSNGPNTCRIATSDGQIATFRCHRERDEIILTSDGQPANVRVKYRGVIIAWRNTSKPISIAAEPAGASPITAEPQGRLV
jgi:alpha-D-xyloside xylohydrolase